MCQRIGTKLGCLKGAKMSEADGVAGKGAEHTDERIDQERREALTRLAKYTAPAMLAMLSVEGRRAGISARRFPTLA